MVYVRIGGFFVLFEKYCRGHYLSGLAVAALRDVLGDPCFLQRVRKVT